jgi:L-arabinose isomerase
MKVMATGLGGASFMEDYTYHMEPGNKLVLGSHMLEICPSIAEGRPSLEVHPLGIGGKADPARLVFNTPAGPGLHASLVHLGNRFRLLVNEVDCVAAQQPMPRLPVARALWVPRPNFEVACASWIHAGGAHHTGFSQWVTTEMIEDFAGMSGLELVVIDADTRVRQLRQELEWNEVAYALKNGFLA